MKKVFLFWLSLWLPIIAIAAPPSWKISPTDSTLTFTGTQNDAPIEGKFTQFEGEIQFDPNQLKESNAIIKVKTDSIFTSLKDIGDTLQGTDWLSTKAFPEATFQATSFDKKDDQNYQAHGNLTIRDKTFPITIDFSLTNYSPEKATIKGTAKFKRSLWGLGQGEWSNTNYIKDEIKVDFVLELRRA